MSFTDRTSEKIQKDLSQQSCMTGREPNSIISVRKQPCGAYIPCQRGLPSCLKFPLVKSCSLRQGTDLSALSNFFFLFLWYPQPYKLHHKSSERNMLFVKTIKIASHPTSCLRNLSKIHRLLYQFRDSRTNHC